MRENIVMQMISLSTAAYITGMTKRTLWRHISNGKLFAHSSLVHGDKTMVSLSNIVSNACLPLEPDDYIVILDADQGKAVAQCDLALMLLAVHRSVDAVHWLDKSAKQGYPDAMCFLGRCYLAGDGVSHDLDAGLMWLSHASAKGHRLAQALIQLLQSEKGRELLEGQDPTYLDSALDDVERTVLLSALAETADPA